MRLEGGGIVRHGFMTSALCNGLDSSGFWLALILAYCNVPVQFIVLDGRKAKRRKFFYTELRKPFPYEPNSEW